MVTYLGAFPVGIVPITPIIHTFRDINDLPIDLGLWNAKFDFGIRSDTWNFDTPVCVDASISIPALGEVTKFWEPAMYNLLGQFAGQFRTGTFDRFLVSTLYTWDIQ